MRILRALGDFFSDLVKGDPVALAIAGFFLLLATAVATVWIIDLKKRKRADKKKKPVPRRETTR